MSGRISIDFVDIAVSLSAFDRRLLHSNRVVFSVKLVAVQGCNSRARGPLPLPGVKRKWSTQVELSACDQDKRLPARSSTARCQANRVEPSDWLPVVRYWLTEGGARSR